MSSRRAPVLSPWLVVPLLCLTLYPSGSVFAKSIQECMQLSHLSFEGTIQALHASSLPPIAAADTTFLVSIDTVFAPIPPAMGDVQGHTITVISQHPMNLFVGQRHFFFVNPRLYGYNMAVLEVCRVEVDADSAEVLDNIANAARDIADKQLLERLDAAEKVVVANVRHVAPYHGGTPQVVIGSEHNPDWWTASLKVLSTEKGVADTSLAPLFAHSMDVAWVGAPKLAIGPDTSIFILDQATILEYNTSELTVQDPLDVQPISELARIRALLSELRRRR